MSVVTNRPIYDTSSPQNMIRFMMTGSPHRQVIQIPLSLTLNRDFDFELMKKALHIEAERNDCMRLAFFMDGLKYKQFFRDHVDIGDIPIKYFKTEQEMEAFFTKEAARRLNFFRDEHYRFVLYQQADGKKGIFINVSHLVMDAAAIFILVADACEVYEALKENKPMPKPLGSYEEALKKELEIKNDPHYYKREEEIFEKHMFEYPVPEYLALDGSKRLDRIRKRRHDPHYPATQSYNPFNSKSGFKTSFASKEDSDMLFDFCQEYNFSPEVMIQLAMHIHLSSINHDSIDHCLFTLCSRRNNRNTKRCGGNMTNSLFWRTQLPNNMTFMQAAKQLSSLQSWMFRHCDYPFLSAMKWYFKTTHAFTTVGHPCSGMFSWIAPENKTLDKWGGCDVRIYNSGHYPLPFYAMASKDINTQRLKFTAFYRAYYIKEKDFDALFDRMIQALRLGITDPDITLQKIKQNLT